MFKNQSQKFKGLRWSLLILIGMSVTFTTLHSHHRIQWKIAKHPVQTGPQLTRDSAYCPFSGYLYGAKIVKGTPQIAAVAISAHIVPASKTQYLDPFSGHCCGRSPPFYG